MTSELEAKIYVTVEVNYLKQESNPMANSYAYAYTVTINNLSLIHISLSRRAI